MASNWSIWFSNWFAKYRRRKNLVKAIAISNSQSPSHQGNLFGMWSDMGDAWKCVVWKINSVCDTLCHSLSLCVCAQNIIQECHTSKIPLIPLVPNADSAYFHILLFSSAKKAIPFFLPPIEFWLNRPYIFKQRIDWSCWSKNTHGTFWLFVDLCNFFGVVVCWSSPPSSFPTTLSISCLIFDVYV